MNFCKTIVILLSFLLTEKSFGQNSFQFLDLTSDDFFRLKKVELYANKIYGPQVTTENYFLFEFPQDTLTLLVFAKKVKKTVKNKLNGKINVDNLHSNDINDNLFLNYENELFRVYPKPNLLVRNSAFFTKKEAIYINDNFYEFANKKINEKVLELYGNKYGHPGGVKRLEYDIIVTDVNDKIITLKTNTYDSDYNPPDYVYKIGIGVLKIFGSQYQIKVTRILKVSGKKNSCK